MPRMTQDRFRSLLVASDNAIEKLDELTGIVDGFRQNEFQSILLKMAQKGLDEDHPLAPEIIEIKNFFDKIIDLIKSGVDLGAIRILEREKAHFNQTRVRANNQAREYQNKLRRAKIKELHPKENGIEIDLDENKTREERFHSWLLDKCGEGSCGFNAIYNRFLILDPKAEKGELTDLLNNAALDGFVSQIDEANWQINPKPGAN